MRNAGLAALALVFAYVVIVAVFGGATSVPLIVGYIVASLGAWALSMAHRPWGGRIKWAWVALSIVVMGAIVMSMWNMLLAG